MKVSELKDRLEKIISMGFGDFEVVISTKDQKGNEVIAGVDGFIDKLEPFGRLRLYSDKEGNITEKPW